MIPKDVIGDAASEAGWPVGRPVYRCRQKRIRLSGGVGHISPESQLCSKSKLGYVGKMLEAHCQALI